MKLQFSRAALQGLVRLREFIATHNPVAANRVADRLLRAIKGLVITSRIGRSVDAFPRGTGIHFWPVCGAVRSEKEHALYSPEMAWQGKQMTEFDIMLPRVSQE